jgi:hypothetical protein
MTNRTFAVSFFCMSSNELHTELVHAETWKDAAVAHSKSLFKPYANDATGDIESPVTDINTIAAAKTFAFDCDGGFDIIELDIDLDTACIVVVGDKEIREDEEADQGNHIEIEVD